MPSLLSHLVKAILPIVVESAVAGVRYLVRVIPRKLRPKPKAGPLTPTQEKSKQDQIRSATRGKA